MEDTTGFDVTLADSGYVASTDVDVTKSDGIFSGRYASSSFEQDKEHFIDLTVT